MVAFRIFGGIFSVRPAATILTILLVAVLCCLGHWQMERMVWKQKLIDSIHDHLGQPPIDLNHAYYTNATSEFDYRPATALGRFQNDRELFRIAISSTGEGGYDVITPMELSNGRILLVDRGWIPYALKGPMLRMDGQINDETIVNGILRLPGAHNWMTPANKPDRNEWYTIDVLAMGDATHNTAPLPFILEADAKENRGGFPVGGQTRIDVPNNHKNYAITWYTLASILIAIYLMSSWKREEFY